MNIDKKQKKESNITSQNNMLNEITQNLLYFSKSENNIRLNEMIADLINYYKDIYLKEKISAQNNDKNINNTLYSNLQKNLNEIIYIKDKEKRNELINNIHIWYKDKLKCNKKLKFIKERKYISPKEIEHEKKFNIDKPLFHKIKKINTSRDLKHRNRNILDKESLNSLDEYNKIRHLIKQMDIDINKICTKKRMVRGKCGTIEDKKIFINEGLKNANDYSLPLMILDVDKKINNSKHKLFAEK